MAVFKCYHIIITMQFSSSLSKATVKNYTMNLRQLGVITPDDISKLYNLSQFTTESITTQKNRYVAIIALLSQYPDHALLLKKYRDLVQPLYDQINETPKVISEAPITWNDVISKRDQLIVGTLEHVVLSLYIELPPRRSKDYLEMTLDGESNLYSNGVFIFKDYKTAKTYGEQVAVATPFLKMTINKYLNGRTIGYLLERDGKKLGANGITYILNYFLGKGIGSTELRHIYISHVTGDMNKAKAKLATQMAHSVNMQNLYDTH